MTNTNVNTNTTATILNPVTGSTTEKLWILTVKDKKNKTFKNVVFCTETRAQVEEYIVAMRAKKEFSFVSLQDLSRVTAYVNTGEITKEFTYNLKALETRKVPGDYKEMFSKIVDAIKTNKTRFELPVTVEDVKADTAPEKAPETKATKKSNKK